MNKYHVVKTDNTAALNRQQKVSSKPYIEPMLTVDLTILE